MAKTKTVVEAKTSWLKTNARRRCSMCFKGLWTPFAIRHSSLLPLSLFFSVFLSLSRSFVTIHSNGLLCHLLRILNVIHKRTWILNICIYKCKRATAASLHYELVNALLVISFFFEYTFLQGTRVDPSRALFFQGPSSEQKPELFVRITHDCVSTDIHISMRCSTFVAKNIVQ